MKIIIKKGEEKDIKKCVDILVDSILGEDYFTVEGASNEITRGIKNNEVYIATDEDGKCIGFVWGIIDAAFKVYPYLHIVAVDKKYKGLGIGRKLIDYCENIIFKDEPKVFLVVSNHNLEAKKLYEQLGYVQVGEIPGLYREGITEYLMMKTK